MFPPSLSFRIRRLMPDTVAYEADTVAYEADTVAPTLHYTNGAHCSVKALLSLCKGSVKALLTLC
jgi:hypothetical protein